MDGRLTDEYKEKQAKEVRPRVRRAGGLSKKAKEAALKNFEIARKLGLKKGQLTDLSNHLTTHYRRVLDETQKQYDDMVKLCGKDYIDTMLKGLSHWVEAGENGYLSWGIMNLTKTQV